MATTRWGAVGVAVGSCWVLGLAAAGAETAPAVLREVPRPEAATRVVLELRAEGRLRPGAAPGRPEPKPVPIRVESRLDLTERVLEAGPDGAPLRAIRSVRQAAVAINGAARPLASQLRPEVSLLVASRRAGGVACFSPGGPLTRPELDLVQGPADPLLLGGLLPEKPVAVGATWPIGPELARSLSDYDALASNTLRAELEALDADRARVHLAGAVHGAARGGEGTVTLEGAFTFDRRAGLIDRLDLTRTETRAPGHVEAGLDFRGTLTVERRPVPVPAELADPAIRALPTGDRPPLELLQYRPPGGKYVLRHDRDWHLFWEDSRLAVLKRLDHGELVAQCNLSVGPGAGKGRHQDPAQFREDIRRALGRRFVAFLGDGEVTDGADPAGGYRYRIAVSGREGDRPILWYYYLVAGPEGDQVLVTFTLNATDRDRFGDQDLRLIGSLRWEAGPAASAAR